MVLAGLSPFKPCAKIGCFFASSVPRLLRLSVRVAQLSGYEVVEMFSWHISSKVTKDLNLQDNVTTRLPVDKDCKAAYQMEKDLTSTNAKVDGICGKVRRIQHAECHHADVRLNKVTDCIPNDEGQIHSISEYDSGG
jgi:hypothetical protein